MVIGRACEVWRYIAPNVLIPKYNWLYVYKPNVCEMLFFIFYL